MQHEENLCYPALNKTIGLQKGGLLRDILPGRQVPKPFFDCGVKAAIISDIRDLPV
jgi:hypothetical protein